MGNRKTLGLVLAFLAFVIVWQVAVVTVEDYMGWERQPIADEPVEVVERGGDDATTRPADAGDGQVDAATPTTRGAPDEPAAIEGLRVVAGEPRTLVLGGEIEDRDPYAIRLTLNTVGAGVEEAILKSYSAEVDQPDPYRFEVPYALAPDETRPLSTQRLTINGQELDLGSVPWRVREERTDDRRALLYVDVFDGDTRVAQVQKRFELFARDAELDNGATEHGGYEVLVRQSVINATDAPIEVSSTLNGTTTPPRELEGAGYDRTVLRGVTGEEGRVRYEAEQVESFDDGEPSRTYLRSEEPLAWFGSGTIYFNAIVRPVEPSQIEAVRAEAVNPQSSDADRRVGIAFDTAPTLLAAGETDRLPLRVYLGPKKRDLLEGGYYSAAGIQYDKTLISPFGCTWCVFQPVVDILVALLSVFQAIFRDWGLAIIALVVLVRTLLHPITRRSQKNIMRMSKLAPKIQAAKEKYGDDKQKMAQAMAEIAPEQTQALLFGCLPMLLQTPIWIALYSTLQATFELRHEPFLYGLTWIEDLSRPDHLVEFGRSFDILPFIGLSISGINLLPLLMAVVFYLQIKLQPQPTTVMSDEQKAQQKMIQILMVTVFPIFLYSMPSGLNLYILTSTAIGIVETKLIRNNLKREEEEEEKAKAEGRVPEEKPKGAFGRRLDAFKETLAARVAEAQKQAQAAQQQKAASGNRGGGKGKRR